MPGNIWPSLGKAACGPHSIEARQWSDSRSDELDASDVEAVIDSMKQIEPRDDHARDEIRKAMDYFEKNKERMRYASFRSQGLFVGSNKIIALRCCQLSGRWEEFREERSAG